MSGNATDNSTPVNSITFAGFDPARVPSPCYVIDRAVIDANLSVLGQLQSATGARVLAALKAFACPALAPLYQQYLSGTCASGLYEARLGQRFFRGETHVFSAAYKPEDLREILRFADHVVFNTPGQWQRFQPLIREIRQQRGSSPSFGLRINPDHSEGTVPIYDPCAPGSRLGTLRERLTEQDLDGISGLHFHNLCEHGFEPLARTMDVVERQFGDWLHRLTWLNIGGGHLITGRDYDVGGLVSLLVSLAERYRLQLYLEPGETIAINSGVLVAEVLDIGWNELDQAVLDTSATCHMPDILEMPYRPTVLGAAEAGVKAHTYRLGGMTCLAGDVIGDYSFDQPLVPGQRLMFDDMAHYTLVKTTTFNGIALPCIAIWDSRTDALEQVFSPSFRDFRDRLGQT